MGSKCNVWCTYAAGSGRKCPPYLFFCRAVNKMELVAFDADGGWCRCKSKHRAIHSCLMGFEDANRKMLQVYVLECFTSELPWNLTSLSSYSLFRITLPWTAWDISYGKARSVTKPLCYIDNRPTTMIKTDFFFLIGIGCKPWYLNHVSSSLEKWCMEHTGILGMHQGPQLLASQLAFMACLICRDAMGQIS